MEIGKHWAGFNLPNVAAHSDFVWPEQTFVFKRVVNRPVFYST